MLTYKKFMETIDRLEEAQILLAALELKLFTHLEKKKLTAKALAKKTGTTQEGLEALLNTLVTMKALRLSSGKYSNAPDMYKHFCETSPHYKKGTVMLRQEDYEEYGHLLQVIRKGRGFEGEHEADDPERRRLFTHAMHERSETRSKRVASHLTQSKVGRLLDLGCGPGSYSMEILKQNRSARATLLDRASALSVAEEIWEKNAVWKRTETLPGDLFDTHYGEGYDTILFSNILHIYSPQENKMLLRKILRALNPGGRVVLLDYFLNDDRTQPYQASMFSLTMLLFTETGKTYTWKETETLLRQTGFSKLKRISLEDDSGLLVGIKKQ